MLFNYDWWFRTAYNERIDLARKRCAASRFPNLSAEDAEKDENYSIFLDELEARTIVYLRDGFSYEVKDIVASENTTTLTFECMPADESYKVGCFVVTVPFDDIVRVEVFAVHPDEKPEDMPSIKGFASSQPSPPPGKRTDERPLS